MDVIDEQRLEEMSRGTLNSRIEGRSGVISGQRRAENKTGTIPNQIARARAPRAGQ